jgi:hypothetical protein
VARVTADQFQNLLAAYRRTALKLIEIIATKVPETLYSAKEKTVGVTVESCSPPVMEGARCASLQRVNAFHGNLGVLL